MVVVQVGQEQLYQVDQLDLDLFQVVPWCYKPVPPEDNGIPLRPTITTSDPIDLKYLSIFSGKRFGSDRKFIDWFILSSRSFTFIP
jgi:hypothetical protein